MLRSDIHSYSTPTSEHFDYINGIIHSLESKQIPCGILLDLSRAFDSVNHSILIDKLERFGVRGTALNWFKSHLSNCKQVTRLPISNNSHVRSQESLISQGVPQGSILGPLLFIVYFNDIYAVGGLSVDHSLVTVNYADDTSLLICDNTLDAVVDSCGKYLREIELWLEANHLQINHNKTNIILFKTKTKNYPQYININRVNYALHKNARLLGVAVDDGLKWIDHVDSLCGRLSSSCYALSQLRNYVSKPVLWVTYYGCYYPLLKYGIVVWGSCSELQRLFVIQKKIMRTILCMKYRQSCRGIFKCNNILTVPSIYTGCR